jgi:RNA polymerase sigma-70 factor, ECF subfamily
MSKQNDSDSEFVQLMISHQTALRFYVNALMSGHMQADDVIQLANIAIWEKRGEFSMDTNFKAWMFKIARFKVLSHWRDDKRSRLWICPPQTLEKLSDAAEDLTTEELDQREKMLQRCLESLRPKDKALITLRYYKETSLKQLATDAGRSINSLEVSLHRIRRTLRDCVQRKLKQAGGEI